MLNENEMIPPFRWYLHKLNHTAPSPYRYVGYLSNLDGGQVMEYLMTYEICEVWVKSLENIPKIQGIQNDTN